MSTTAQAVGFSFVEQLAQDLKDERLELPAFPEAVLRIQRALQSSDTSTDDVVRILGSEPALAARLLRIANSVEFRRMDQDITDLRKAVSRMGFNMVRSVSVAFAMRALRKKDTYSPAAQAELERAWKDSIDIAAACFVIAKRFTRVNPDQALLTGLLHVLGRLYIIMRAKDVEEMSEAQMREVVDGWHASIGKAILESWGLPEALQSAIEHQDQFEIELDGVVSLTDILIAAKLVTRGEKDVGKYPALRRVGVAAADRAVSVTEEYAEEIQGVRNSLSEDGAHRRWPGAHRGAARSRRQLRAADHPQARASLHRLRPEDRGDVRPRHDGARDPGISGRDVRHGGLAGVHQQSHRRGDGRGHRLAEPAARADVPGGLLRCAAREDPRRRGGAQQGRVSGARRAARRHAATCWASGSSRPKAQSSG